MVVSKPRRVWEEKTELRKPLGRWLIENMPRGADLEIPDLGGDSRREIPFSDWDDDDWGDK